MRIQLAELLQLLSDFCSRHFSSLSPHPRIGVPSVGMFNMAYEKFKTTYSFLVGYTDRGSRDSEYSKKKSSFDMRVSQMLNPYTGSIRMEICLQASLVLSPPQPSHLLRASKTHEERLASTWQDRPCTDADACRGQF
jgi:hypothetical protein